MLQFETEKGELNLIECWIDEDYSERYEDGERDLIWIDRIHEDKYETIDEFVEEKFAGISDTIYIEIHAIRLLSDRFEEGDEYMIFSITSPSMIWAMIVWAADHMSSAMVSSPAHLNPLNYDY